MITIIRPTKYTVVMENYDGKCKRIKVLAYSSEEAWGIASMKKGWYPVQVI
jgi:hypothetical protein